MHRYITYWIPHLEDFEFNKPAKDFIKSFELSEADDKDKLYVSLDLDIKNYKISIKDKNSKSLASLNISNEDKFLKCGFLVCEVQNLEKPLTEEVLQRKIYHGIKEFWHYHIFHKNDEDTKLRAMLSYKKPSFEEICNHYVIQILERLKEKFNNLIMNLLNRLEEKEINYFLKIKNFYWVQIEILNLLGEINYFKELCKICSKEKIKLIIHNYERVLKIKRDIVSTKLGRSSFYIQTFLALLGLLLGILGLLFTIHLL